MKKRPIPISIIAISQGIILPVFIGHNLIVWGFNLSILLNNITLMIYIILASFGLWKGKEWGWWLTNIYYIHLLLGMIISIIKILFIVPNQYKEMEISLFNAFSPYGIIALALGILIPFYLFRKSILNYFEIRNVKYKLLIITIIALVWLP